MSKNLVIKSPQQLYNIVKDIKDRDNSILPFIDRIELFLYGCPCEAENYWMQTLTEYKKLNNCDLSFIKRKFECDYIQIYLDDSLLFTI
jgi:hypothetical protein